MTVTIVLLCANLVAVVGAAVWLRREVKSHVAMLISGGCPMALAERTMEARLAEVDRKLEAHERQMDGVVDASQSATSAVSALKVREERAQRIKTAPAHRLPVNGL